MVLTGFLVQAFALKLSLGMVWFGGAFAQRLWPGLLRRF
jgi:hypothetical protein